MINISPDIIGRKFTTVKDPTVEYICVGYACNTTFLIIGALNDTVNNRFTLESIKLSDAKFIGQMPHK